MRGCLPYPRVLRTKRFCLASPNETVFASDLPAHLPRRRGKVSTRRACAPALPIAAALAPTARMASKRLAQDSVRIEVAAAVVGVSALALPARHVRLPLECPFLGIRLEPRRGRLRSCRRSRRPAVFKPFPCVGLGELRANGARADVHRLARRLIDLRRAARQLTSQPVHETGLSFARIVQEPIPQFPQASR